MHVVIVLPMGRLSFRPRAYKIAKFLHGKRADIEHWAWDRERSGTEELFPFSIEKKVLVSDQRKVLGYIKWCVALFFRSWLIKKDTVVWSIGFESTIPLVLASRIKGFSLVFDDSDRFSISHTLSLPVRRVVIMLENLVSRLVSVQVVPTFSRYDSITPKMIEIKNYPAQEVLNLVESEVSPFVRTDGEEIVVYLNGRLTRERGAGIFLEAAEKLRTARPSLRFVVAGSIREDLAKRLIELPNVTYVGRVSNEQALSIYKQVDFVATYYDPALSINRLAESNKWGDALKMGVAVLVNEEVLTASYLQDYGCSARFPYHAVDEVVGFLSEVSVDDVCRMKDAARKAGKEAPSFEEGLGKVLCRLRSTS